MNEIPHTHVVHIQICETEKQYMSVKIRYIRK